MKILFFSQTPLSLFLKLGVTLQQYIINSRKILNIKNKEPNNICHSVLYGGG